MEYTEESLIKERILDTTIDIFSQDGLKFTMDSLAKKLSMSKKTIYKFFPDKQSLLHEMVDYSFNQIKMAKRNVVCSSGDDIVEVLTKVLQAMPERYENVNLGQLYVLKDKYPQIYHHVEQRLESDWENTILLMNKGMEEGKIREVSIPIFKTMMLATLEQFFKEDVLVLNQITYQDALREVVEILINGIIVK